MNCLQKKSLGFVFSIIGIGACYAGQNAEGVTTPEHTYLPLGRRKAAGTSQLQNSHTTPTFV